MGLLLAALPLIPAGAQISDAQAAALVEALRRAAPQTRADAGLYSDWQIKPANIPRWSQRCIGVELTPTEFESNPVTAREILTCVMGGVLADQYRASGGDIRTAVRRAAAWWLTGDPERHDAPPAAGYADVVLDFYQAQQGGSAADPPPPPATAAAPESPASSGIAEPQVAALVEALRLAAPRNSGAGDGLYSDWQIKPANIARWSQRCIGVELTVTEFESNPDTAREVLACVMGDVLRQQYQASGGDEAAAVERAAAWWLTGDPEQYRNDRVATYTRKVLGFYQDSP
ncbi:MAG: hypothetical protein M3Z21_02755 [Pseudomonadota bacterium]|nr:hypothetical protein [Pseudomonadota bacterium]